MTTEPRSRPGPTQFVAHGGLALLHCVALAATALAGLVVFVLVVLAGSLIGLGIGLSLLPPTVLVMRRLTNVVRRLARDWSEVPIAEPYVPEPAGQTKVRRIAHLLGDRANWRDLAWMLVDVTVGIVLTLTPVVLVLHGIYGLLMPVLVTTGTSLLGNFYVVMSVTDQQTAWFAVLLGAAQLPLALLLAPHLLRLHAKLAAMLLSPTRVDRLTSRVQHLSETRKDVVDTQVDELRRIERNLHDGAQARLVAMGMTLDAAMHLMAKDPEKARSLLDEAKNSSSKALQELRNLVRGFQPPVLQDRGIADAIRTLAIENPLAIDTTIDLPGRPSAAVESAAYFTVSEVLSNAMKHSGAATGSIDVRYVEGKLRIVVRDDGRGGADIDQGTGLLGIQRRLAPLDGVITVLSPKGGPTEVSIEIPCTITAVSSNAN